MKPARTIAIIALAFLAISSCIGAVPLIIDPSGGILKMPLSLLDHSPFRSFLIPGLILLFANGIFSLAIWVAALRKMKGYGLWVALQGCVLFGWITIEVFLIRAVSWPHFIYWAVGVVLIVSGAVTLRGGRLVHRQS